MPMKIDLDDHPFLYGKVVSNPCTQEGGRSFMVENKSGFIIRMWKIDKVVFRDRKEQRCDFLIKAQSEEGIYFWVELKGKDITKACGQILNTLQWVNITKEAKQEARIITTGTNRIDIRAIEYLKLDNLMRKARGRLKTYTNYGIETI